MSDRIGDLLVVATPIGNLNDLSERQRASFESADIIYAEDTRETLKLLNYMGLARTVRSLNKNNELRQIDSVLQHLKDGSRVVVCSDAGTPCINDPGAFLIDSALDLGAKVSPIPGASSLSAALSVCGFAAGDVGILYLGFFPAKGGARTKFWEKVSEFEGMVVCFETPHRMARFLEEATERLPTRRIALCRELTKLHEEVLRGTAGELKNALTQYRGEFTLVFDAAPKEPHEREVEGLANWLKESLMLGVSVRDCASVLSVVTGEKRKKLYRLALDISLELEAESPQGEC